jgi:hypothetical protein
MPTFHVEQKTNLPPDESFQKIREYLEKGDDLKKLDSNIHCTFDPASKTGMAKGNQFECKLKVTEESSSTVKLEISIPFLLSPFKGKIQETLQRKLKKLFA